MNPRITKALKHAALGLFATMWNAGWQGLAAIAGIDGASLIGGSDKLHTLTMHEMLAAWVGGACVHGVIWIIKNPIPETIETNPPMPVQYPDPKL